MISSNKLTEFKIILSNNDVIDIDVSIIRNLFYIKDKTICFTNADRELVNEDCITNVFVKIDLMDPAKIRQATRNTWNIDVKSKLINNRNISYIIINEDKFKVVPFTDNSDINQYQHNVLDTENNFLNITINQE